MMRWIFNIEGFALEQVLRLIEPDEAYFWATYAGAELDLLIFKNGKRYGVEFKRADAFDGDRDVGPEAGTPVGNISRRPALFPG